MPSTTPSPGAPAGSTGSPPARLDLDVVSDVICPWCYIAKARLARAADLLARDGIGVSVTWRAYELNPDMPIEGMDRRAYRTRKFGSWERSQGMDDHVVQVGRDEGLDFVYSRVSRTPNTRRAHRLAYRALHEGGPELQGRVVDRLFEAYFDTGDDVGDPDTLVSIARACGMRDSGLDGYVRSTEDEEAVVHDEMLGIRAGLRGVPAVLHGDLLLFSGAQPVDDMVRILGSVHRRRVSPDTSDSATDSDSTPAIGPSIFAGAR